MSEYEEEKAIEFTLEAEIQEVVDSGKVWHPHNMAYGCRQALLRAGYYITKDQQP